MKMTFKSNQITLVSDKRVMADVLSMAESVERNLAGSVGRLLAGSVERNLAGSVENNFQNSCSYPDLYLRKIVIHSVQL